MERQRAEARASWKGSGEQAEERVWFELRETLGATEFLGYEHDTAEAQVRALVVGGRPVDHAEPGAEVMVVTNQTPFYGESGGQIGDTGTLRRGPAVVQVTDTQKKSAATSSSTSAGSKAARSRSATPSSSGSTATAAPACAARTPRRTCCTPRCAATSAAT